MLNFKTPTLDDKKTVDSYLKNSTVEGCGFSFGNLYLWRKAYDMTFAVADGFLFISSSLGNSRAFACPVGEGDMTKALAHVIEYAAAAGIDPVFYAVTEKQKEAMRQAMPDSFCFCDERDYYDYIYLTENLATLAGRKYHGKRNHIAKFEKTHNWSFQPISEENLPQCRLILQAWAQGKFPSGFPDVDGDEAAAEMAVAEESIALFSSLGYEGGILYADGEPAAYAMGEALNDRVFCTHVEKAIPQMRDAYPLINRETARMLVGRYQYINREDDAGDEGLRKAKLSYRPDILLVKNAAYYHGKL